MKLPHFLAPGIIAAALVSCDNPADRTATATVGDPATPSGDATTDSRWNLSDESTLKFVGSKFNGSSHDGGFKDITAYILVNGEDTVTGGSVDIDMNSTWSDNDKLTKHLKTVDFFDVENHPTTSFVLTDVTKNDDGNYSVSGNLKMRGVEKNITFPATASRNGDKITVAAGFDINRKQWGINYTGAAGALKEALIRDEVVLDMKLTFVPENTGSEVQ